jgi:Na+/melibiose symporter-like transporter
MVAFLFPFFKEVYVDSAFWTIVTNGIAFCFIGLLPRERQKKLGLPEKGTVSLQSVLGNVIKQWRFLIFVGGASLLFSVNQVVTVFLVQVSYQQVGLRDSSFGYPFFALVLVSLLSSQCSVSLSNSLGKGNALVFCCILSILGILLLVWQSGIAIVLLGVLLLRFGASAAFPLVVSIEAQQAEGTTSATILSIYALVSETIELVLTLILGYLANRNLQVSLLVAGGFTLIGLVSLYLGRKLPVIGRWLS